MKDAIIVSLTKEGVIGSAIYPFSEELCNNQAEDVPIHVF